MTSPRRYAALLSALFALSLTLSACGGGGGVPSDAVVKIGPDTITKTAFDHVLKVTAKQQVQVSGTLTSVAIPDRPNFTKCIAQKKQSAPKPAKGQPAPTDATYKAQCQQDYTKLSDQAMQFLISSAWIEGESADQGIKMSDADVKKDFDKQLAQSFPKYTNYKNFLKQTGYDQEDLLYRVKVQELTDRLRAKVLAGSDQVSAAQIANYYNNNKSKFGVPEKRDFHIVMTKTEDKANEAKAALDGGQSWKTVVAEYSIDPGTKASGGLLKAIPEGQQEKALGDAMFSAQKGDIRGPVKSQAGYIVFVVDKIIPGQPQPLKQAKAAAKQQLIAQQQQTRVAAFTADLQKKWKGRTECQKGYATQDCKNAPKAQPAPAPPPAAAPTGTGSSSGGATTNK